jgi:hypothetical protein
MNEGAPSQQSRVLWFLKDTSGVELRCELHRSGHEVQLRFCSGTELLHETPLIELSEVESWTRVWARLLPDERLVGARPRSQPPSADTAPRGTPASDRPDCSLLDQE